MPHIKISSTLRKYVAGYNPEKGLDLALPGTHALSVKDLALQLSLPLEEIKFAMINGKTASMDAIVAENDRIAFFPAVGGG